MFFLIIDSRFGTPIHVFLELDPRLEGDYPGQTVREVTLESPASRVDGRFAIGHTTSHMAAGYWQGRGDPIVRNRFS